VNVKHYVFHQWDYYYSTPKEMNKYITTKQASEMTGYSKRTIERKIAEGIIPTRSMGLNGMTRIWVMDLHSLMVYTKPFLNINEQQRERVRLIASE
jgi:excisionase family DNA binding protein